MVIFGGDDEVQESEYLLKADGLRVDVGKVVGDILDEEFTVESDIPQKFEKLLDESTLTLGLRVRLLLELLSKIHFNLSRCSFSVMENYNIAITSEYSILSSNLTNNQLLK